MILKRPCQFLGETRYETNNEAQQNINIGVKTNKCYYWNIRPSHGYWNSKLLSDSSALIYQWKVICNLQFKRFCYSTLVIKFKLRCKVVYHCYDPLYVTILQLKEEIYLPTCKEGPPHSSNYQKPEKTNHQPTTHIDWPASKIWHDNI